MKKRRWIKRGLLGLAGTVVLVECALLLTPLPNALTEVPAESTVLVDREGRPLRALLVDDHCFARRVGLDEVSSAVVDATLSAEDKRFRHHPGVDPLACARALVERARGGRKSGASTISQQLVKLAMPGERSLRRKLGEVWIALKLEQSWSKERILAEYLNRLDYGNLQTGIASASRHYFDKPPGDLSVAEAAFLAGLPRAPGRLNPHANLAGARERQRWVLGRMRANGRLEPGEYERAVERPLSLQPPARQFEAPHFVDLLLRRQGVCDPAGGVVRTTLDLDLNRRVEHCLARHIAGLEDRDVGTGAVVVLHNPTGEVLALAGSADYFDPDAGAVNGAWIRRSPGSAVKPFSYLLALENGHEPCTVVADVPTSFATPTGIYRPNNYNHRFHGPVSLRFALANSLNVGAIRVLELAGGPQELHRGLMRHGVTTLDHPAGHYGLGLTLGNGELLLLELAAAYGDLARLGVHRPFRLLLREGLAPGDRVASREAAWLVTDMLSDNAARAPAFGWRSYLDFDFPVACKTGTSSDYRDNWAVGYTPEFTVAAWVGNADGRPMRGITGVTGAAPVMHEVMEHLHREFGTSTFERPAGLRRHRVDPLTGRRVPAGHPGAVLEWCREAPVASRPEDYDEEGRVRLGPEYAEWLRGGSNPLARVAVAAEPRQGVEIQTPKAGSVYFLDADLPAEAQWIPLRATGEVEWRSESPLRIEGDRLWIREGRHEITAVDPRSGRVDSTWIEVRRW